MVAPRLTFWAPGAANAGIRAMRLTGGDKPALEPLWTNETLPGGSGSSPDLSADGSRIYLTDNAGGLHVAPSTCRRSAASFSPIGQPQRPRSGRRRLTGLQMQAV